MIASSRPNRYQVKNQALRKCLMPYGSGIPTYARVVGCDATNDWAAHSFDVR